MNFYNEIDPHAASWLRELIKNNLIPSGVVDERSITEIKPDELNQYTQCHFFAGIGGWSRALELAGWGADQRVWTGSCPCQPFSTAGNRLGTADERHLWPAFANLIRECRPPIVFGEQVARKAGRAWLAGVLSDLEGMGYAGAGADLCAAGVGAPHVRQRIYWGGVLLVRGVGDTEHSGLEGHRWAENPRDKPRWLSAGANRPGTPPSISASWDDFEAAYFAGGETRRIQRGTLPLADGVPSRVVKLRGYGNAIVPQLAAEFIRCFT